MLKLGWKRERYSRKYGNYRGGKFVTLVVTIARRRYAMIWLGMTETFLCIVEIFFSAGKGNTHEPIGY